MRGWKPIIYILIMIPLFSKSQDKEKNNQEEFHRNQISFWLSHMHVPSGSSNGEKKWLVFPSWGLDYNFWINPKWAIGLHNDIVSENFEVEHNEVILERKRPLTSVLAAVYKPGQHFAYMIGMGGEFSSTKSYFVSRLSIEYGHEFGKSWEVNAGLVYDIKWNGYNNWGGGFGISKLF
ncbi:MAG TPA: hypothetical protein VEV87_06020 [Chitinophagaceae bacterium]|nr:hypothetical protein [Chitinophagaceae bacterium]